MYAHQYSAEVFDAWGIDMDGTIDWEPNLDVEEDKKIPNWRDRVHPDFTFCIHVPT